MVNCERESKITESAAKLREHESWLIAQRNAEIERLKKILRKPLTEHDRAIAEQMLAFWQEDKREEIIP